MNSLSCIQISSHLALDYELRLRVHAGSLFEVTDTTVIFNREEKPFDTPYAGGQLVGGVGQLHLHFGYKQLFRLVRKRELDIKARATIFHSVEVDLNAFGKALNLVNGLSLLIPKHGDITGQLISDALEHKLFQFG